jgi:hypothetical protein
MNYTSRAPIREPVPELPEHDIPVAPAPLPMPESGEESIVYLISRITRSCSIPHAETSRQSWNLAGRPTASVDG